MAVVARWHLGGDGVTLFRPSSPQERLMDDGMEEDETSEEAGLRGGEEQAADPPQVGFLTATWTFISTFFTSLIPEGHPQPAN